MIGCECAVCASDDPRNHRYRPSVLVSHEDQHILVDTSPDLRSQALKFGVHRVHVVLMTHHHADHILGIDDLRIYNHRINGKIPIYSDEKTLARLNVVFDYAFSDTKTEQSSPKLEPTVIDGPFDACGMRITPFELMHGSLPILGFHFESPSGKRFAYATDCKVIPDASRQIIAGADLLIVDALRHRAHPTHFNLEEANAAVSDLKPARTLYTHIAHDLDHETTDQELPDGIELAYDDRSEILRTLGSLSFC